MIAQYVDYEHFWLKPLAVRDLARAVTFVAGNKFFAPFLFAVFGIVAVLDVLWMSRQRGHDGAKRAGVLALAAREWRKRIRAGLESPFFLTGFVSVLGLGLFLVLAVFMPVFLPRYLIPFVPGLFMLVVWGVIAMPFCHRWAIRSLIVLYFVGATVWAGVSIAQVDKGLTWEEESEILARAGASDVLFFLDQGFPIPYHDDVQSKVYSFYFHRNAVAARARAYSPDFATFEDPRGQLARFLSEKPGRAVIWTLHPGPIPGPVPTEPEARKQLIKERGFSAVYDHTALHRIDGVTCHATGPASYRKMVCYSQVASTR
jgi:hypothetical protein